MNINISEIPAFLRKPQNTEETLIVHEPLMAILQSYTMIILPDNEFAEKLAWCLEHCQNKFRDISVSDGRAWYFQTEQDATLFTMRWA